MIYELQEAIRSVGFEPPDVITPGKVNRFSTNGKRSDKSGWIFLFPDGEGASFGCWRTGEVHQWFIKREKPLNADEQESMRRQFDEAKAKAKQELEESYRIAQNAGAEVAGGDGAAAGCRPTAAAQGSLCGGVPMLKACAGPCSPVLVEGRFPLLSPWSSAPHVAAQRLSLSTSASNAS